MREYRPDTKTLRAFYVAQGCPGIVALLDYLDSPWGKRIKMIDENRRLRMVLCDARVPYDARMSSKWFRNRGYLNLADRDSALPLRWLYEFGVIISRCKQSELKLLDDRCTRFVEEEERINNTTQFGSPASPSAILHRGTNAVH